jgi:hypothetical protein
VNSNIKLMYFRQLLIFYLCLSTQSSDRRCSPVQKPPAMYNQIEWTVKVNRKPYIIRERRKNNIHKLTHT